MDVPRPSTRPPAKKRPLKSIQPAIDLALDFLGLPKGGLPEAAVAEAERRQLYTTPSHDILVLRDDDMGSTYLASVGNEPLERLEQEAGIELSWL